MTGWWLIGVKETTVYLCMPGDFEEGLCFYVTIFDRIKDSWVY